MRIHPALVSGAAAFIALGSLAIAQTTSGPVEGLRDAPNRTHALTGARVVTGPGKVLENATIVLRDGIITEVGAGLAVPDGARIWELKGRTIYAGFIESETGVGLPEEYRALPSRGTRPGFAAARRAAVRARPTPPPKQPSDLGGAVSWNPRVTPQRNAAELLVEDEKASEKLRSLGFAAAVVTPGRGVFRGSSALVQLSGRDPNRTVLRALAGQQVAFEQSNPREESYPSSLMGGIALIRQTLLDAQWYDQAKQFATQNRGVERPEDNRALAALNVYLTGKAPVVFHAEDELDHHRILQIAEEFKLRVVLRGSGTEYRVLPRLAAAKVPLIIPVNFPPAPEVETAERALDVTLDELEHWQEAPANASRLAKAGLRFAFTSAGLEKPDKFWTHLREAVKRGLSGDDALAALTTVPAALWSSEDRLGTIEKGRIANLVVASGDLFKDEDAVVVTTWVDGEPFETEKGHERDLRGTYALTLTGFPDAKPSFKIEGDPARPKVTFGEKDNAAASVQGGRFGFVPAARLLGIGLQDGAARFSFELPARVGEVLEGNALLPDGRELRWAARRTAAFVKPAPKEDKAEKERLAIPVPIPEAYPAGAFGLAKPDLDAPAAILIRGATVWTSGPQGTLEKADLLVEGGKIKAVGRDLPTPPGAKVIDATGKHVSAGLIDCHSHTAIARGVNEGTHSVTCEVRIGDVVDPTDIGIYRQLAGGLTTANLLHGSANAIGGQNQVIKLRWGLDAEAMKFAGAKPGVKFALGENVKQSNWGLTTTRYPQTRMGVEEIMRDTFLGAREYERQLVEAKAGKLPPVRRSLRLEAALEILKGDRIVHCHAYRQDEVLMLIRLSQELGFTLGTFQHILEGYKVADEIARSGAGASSFADWWNYKHEAADAIPYNAAMLVRAGVITSVNSDSADLARRLNTEAAKSMRYGGLTPAEALSLVTIWPARQLRIEKQVGSLEPGKDADFVIWDANPLSSYAKAEQTWIDGRCHFDRARDQRLREEAAKRRDALVQRALPERLKVIATPPAGSPGSASEGEKKPERDEVVADEGLLVRLLRHRDAHWEREQRAIYHDGTDVHNCSSAEER